MLDGLLNGFFLAIEIEVLLVQEIWPRGVRMLLTNKLTQLVPEDVVNTFPRV
jgi:hypothetical protein